MTLSPTQIARSRPRIPVLYEALGVLAAYFAYFAVRGATESEFERALGHAELIKAFEERLGIFLEPSWQAAILDKQWIVDVSNWVYVWGHWPVIAGVAFWLYRSHRDRYRLVRNAMLISGGIGLVIFTTFPVAPPRLADMGLVDTVVQRSDFYRVLQPPALTNQYAAVPSLHFGWNLLIGIAIFRGSTHLGWRVVGVLSPVAMFAAVVLTGNHYIIDTVVGGTVALVGLRAAYVIAQPATPERRGLRAIRARAAAALRRPPASVGATEQPVPAPWPAELGAAVAPIGAGVPSALGVRTMSGCAPGMPCGPTSRSPLATRRLGDSATILDLSEPVPPESRPATPKVSADQSVARSASMQARAALDGPTVETGVDADTAPLEGGSPVTG